ncbi:3-isopropylmalate dehydratase large subunit, chloroplastic-like isoform X3 [Nicotiana tabacum]|uniref:3-isopropylmalate dehydratase large subunit, chloroplastic-like isoform X3 n=1 Tax=Nicotiana tabacum TaxID=4097 RepID=A0AC58TMS6_TOBAC
MWVYQLSHYNLHFAGGFQENIFCQQTERKPATTGSVKTGMTMTEKILARASDKPEVTPGDNVWVNVDVLMTHDIGGPASFGVFKEQFGQKAKANPDYKGVCHVALAQEGHCRPGEVLLGTDSHTCTAGAFGQFATGIGTTGAGFVLGTGKLLLKVPPTLRFVMDGEMPSYLLAKDLILQISTVIYTLWLISVSWMSHIIGEISVAGATYKTMEFVGTTVECLSMEERMTLCNMVVEADGKNGVIPADKTT